VSAWLEGREGAHLVCGFGEARDCGRPVLVELSALGVCGLEEGAEREEVVAEARALCRLEGCGPVWRWAGGRGGWWGRRRRDEVGSRLLEAGEDGVDVAEVALVGSVCPVAHLVELVGERVHGGRGVTGQQAMRTTTTSTTSLLVSSCQPCELYCTSAYPGVPLTCPSPPQQGPDSSVQRRTLALDSACQSSSLSSLGHARPAVQLELEICVALTHPHVPAVHGRRVQLRRRPPTLPQPQLLAPRPRCRPGQAQQVAQADPSPRARARRPPPRGPQAPRPRQRRRGPRTRAGSGAGRRHAGRGSGRGEGADRGRLGASGRDREEAAGGVPGGRQLCVPLLFSSFSLPCSRYVR